MSYLGIHWQWWGSLLLLLYEASYHSVGDVGEMKVLEAELMAQRDLPLPT